jgi:hypothetical protein
MTFDKPTVSQALAADERKRRQLGALYRRDE